MDWQSRSRSSTLASCSTEVSPPQSSFFVHSLSNTLLTEDSRTFSLSLWTFPVGVRLSVGLRGTLVCSLLRCWNDRELPSALQPYGSFHRLGPTSRPMYPWPCAACPARYCPVRLLFKAPTNFRLIPSSMPRALEPYFLAVVRPYIHKGTYSGPQTIWSTTHWYAALE